MRNQSPDPSESLWRRKLSETERDELRAQPELELEARLTDALAHIPNAPVPSNFTARVLDAIEREETRSVRAAESQSWRWNWRVFFPRVAATAAVLLFATIGFQQYEKGQKRVEVVKSLAQATSAQSVPSVEALNNFDVIEHMSKAGHADTELLAALQ